MTKAEAYAIVAQRLAQLQPFPAEEMQALAVLMQDSGRVQSGAKQPTPAPKVVDVEFEPIEVDPNADATTRHRQEVAGDLQSTVSALLSALLK